ncbi:hypothetical protein [Embleya sp. NPDC005575]|uniref:hypothetical protein n=1 Tax=Embleya sp. NPDC005575 TaxID=3156892 RepID=UPI0033A880DD
MESVRVYECVYADGDLIGTRHLDGAGVEVQHSSGKPVPPRPEGVAPTASHLPGLGDVAWLFMRRRGEEGEETLETRRWWADGTLQSEWTLDGTDRRYYRSGVLWWEHRRVPRGDVRPLHGTWRYHDVHGLLRRESGYDSGSGRGVERHRTRHRTAEEADGRGVTRSGPVEDAVEVGLWQVRDADGTPVREVRLGRLWGNADLPATPAAAELPYSAAELHAVLAEADADDPDGGPAQLARIRLSAREGAAALTPVIGDERPWPAVMVDGPYWHEGIPVSPLTPRSSLTEVIHALRWGESAGPTLARLAHDLFHRGHLHTALDVIDAALLLGDDADRHRTRAVLLRALGRDTDADAVVPGPDHVDPAAARLLLAIRERPADNGPRLAYAELVALSHPEHARLITPSAAATRTTRTPPWPRTWPRCPRRCVTSSSAARNADSCARSPTWKRRPSCVTMTPSSAPGPKTTASSCSSQATISPRSRCFPLSAATAAYAPMTPTWTATPWPGWPGRRICGSWKVSRCRIPTWTTTV